MGTDRRVRLEGVEMGEESVRLKRSHASLGLLLFFSRALTNVVAWSMPRSLSFSLLELTFSYFRYRLAGKKAWTHIVHKSVKANERKNRKHHLRC